MDGCLSPSPHPTLLLPRAAIERFALNVEAFAFSKRSLLRRDQNAYATILHVDASRPHVACPAHCVNTPTRRASSCRALSIKQALTTRTESPARFRRPRSAAPARAARSMHCCRPRHAVDVRRRRGAAVRSAAHLRRIPIAHAGIPAAHGAFPMAATIRTPNFVRISLQCIR